MRLIVIASFLLVLAVTMFMFWLFGGGRERGQLQKRINRIKQRQLPAAKLAQDLSLRRKTQEVHGVSYWLVKPLPNFKRLGDRLERAGKTIGPKQYALRRIVSMLIIIGIVMLVFKKSLMLGISIGIIVGVWLPLKLLQRTINKQSKAFLLLFPNAIDMIVRGLRSGLPVSESLVLVASEVPAPAGTIFGNVSNMMKLGVPMEKALQDTARKLDMTEFNFFTTSIILQRETGGNLAEILNNLSEVLRNRFMMRLKIKAMASEAKASSYVITALPFVVMLLVGLTSPGYMSVLFTDYRGNECLAVAAGMMTFGIWVMNRMTKFEI